MFSIDRLHIQPPLHRLSDSPPYSRSNISPSLH